MIELSKIVSGCREDGVAETVCRGSAAFPRELRPEPFSRARRVTPLMVKSALLGEVWVVPRKFGLSSLFGDEGLFLFCRPFTSINNIIQIKENQP